jgi:hypothetical protein
VDGGPAGGRGTHEIERRHLSSFGQPPVFLRVLWRIVSPHQQGLPHRSPREALPLFRRRRSEEIGDRGPCPRGSAEGKEIFHGRSTLTRRGGLDLDLPSRGRDRPSFGVGSTFHLCYLLATPTDPVRRLKEGGSMLSRQKTMFRVTLNATCYARFFTGRGSDTSSPSMRQCRRQNSWCMSSETGGRPPMRVEFYSAVAYERLQEEISQGDDERFFPASAANLVAGYNHV